jgi:hypothetical protein
MPQTIISCGKTSRKMPWAIRLKSSALRVAAQAMMMGSIELPETSCAKFTMSGIVLQATQDVRDAGVMSCAKAGRIALGCCSMRHP